MCFDFLYNFVSEILLIPRRSDQDIVKRMCIDLYIKSDFNETRDFQNCSNRKFHDNPSIRGVPRFCMRTDRHDETKESLFAVFSKSDSYHTNVEDTQVLIKPKK